VILCVILLFITSTLYAAPIDDATFREVMHIADREGVPRSVAARLMFEESGDPWTGSRGNPDAVGDESTGWTSEGLYQLHTRPENINYLIKAFLIGMGETEGFNIRNPSHNATIALRYLSDLHRRFGTWYMAAARYNAGPSAKVIPEKTKRYASRIINAREPEL
jgi:hypothetical protein